MDNNPFLCWKSGTEKAMSAPACSWVKKNVKSNVKMQPSSCVVSWRALLCSSTVILSCACWKLQCSLPSCASSGGWAHLSVTGSSCLVVLPALLPSAVIEASCGESLADAILPYCSHWCGSCENRLLCFLLDEGKSS